MEDSSAVLVLIPGGVAAAKACSEIIINLITTCMHTRTNLKLVPGMCATLPCNTILSIAMFFPSTHNATLLRKSCKAAGGGGAESVLWFAAGGPPNGGGGGRLL